MSCLRTCVDRVYQFSEPDISPQSPESETPTALPDGSTLLWRIFMAGRTMQWKIAALMAVLLISAGKVQAFAQATNTGTVVGVVTDQSGPSFRAPLSLS